MAKLSEVLTEKSGKWFSVGDVIGVPLLITEDIGAAYDIRLDDDKKYYCIQCSKGGEIKDLHVAKGALRAIAEIMPKEATWKGQRFVINAITGKGYQTKTHVSLYIETKDEGAQKRIPTSDVAQPAQPAQKTSSSTAVLFDTAVLEAIAGMSCGVHESRLDDFITDVANTNHVVCDLAEVKRRLKYGGRIAIDKGVWKAMA